MRPSKPARQPATRERRRAAALLVGLTLTATGAAPAPAADEARAARQSPIAVVLTPHGSYQAAASAIESLLTNKGITWVRVTLPGDTEEDTAQATPGQNTTQPSRPAVSSAPAPAETALGAIREAHPGALIAMGATATSWCLTHVPDTPVVFCMIPDALDLSYLAQPDAHSAGLGGVAMCPSPDDQIARILDLHPTCRRPSILYSERSRKTFEALRAAAQKRSLALSGIEAGKDEFAKAVDTLGEKGCDGVLMIPDAQVYNAAAVQRLLLWGLRQKKPIWTFSAKIVEAGALGAWYVDTQAIAKHTVELACQMAGKKKPPPGGLLYPSEVESAFNERTAGIIGLSIDPQTLARATARYGR